ncbi:MAG: aldehyde dehydrogenase family protein [Solirubrobacteraceae bacterium]|nr:aldehyde dehydrogenase family protein [Solirubrobacteraceae bacterium]
MSTTAAPVTASGSTPGDVVTAEVERLRATFAGGRTRPLAWRRTQIEGIARLLDEQEPRLAAAIEADLGRQAMATFMGDIAPVRAEARHTLKQLAKWVRPQRVRVPMAQLPGKAWTAPEPKGVVLVVGPWNFPVLLTLHPLVSALAAGNAVVVKPSELTPRTSAALAELLPRYVDPDAIAVVEGDASVSGALLAERFDHIFFTGSERVGKIVLRAAAEHLTPVTLELGGKSPVIVSRDANLDVAARRIAWANALNAGQACIAPDYLLVEDAIREPFMERLLREVERTGRDHPSRVINTGHAERLAALLDGHGGAVACGGRVDGAGKQVTPTVITDPDPGSDLMTEEIFGPILPVLSVPSVADAIAFVNDRPKPLALYVFTESQDVVDVVTGSTSSGSVGINHLLYQLLVPELPFGGVGTSGMGAYHGRHGFDTFSHRKAVLHKPTKPDPSMAYPPYGPIASRIMRRMMG